jgi:hypothetical protein
MTSRTVPRIDVPLLVDVSRLYEQREVELKRRMAIMLDLLTEYDPKKPVDVRQSSQGAPIHADMRGFGMHLQVLSCTVEVHSTMDFLTRALAPSARWMRDGALDQALAERKAAWQTVKALVGDLDETGWNKPMCEDDGALGPMVRNVTTEQSAAVSDAILSAFSELPDACWVCGENAHRRRVRDYRFGDMSQPWSEIEPLDAMGLLRVHAARNRRPTLALAA